MSHVFVTGFPGYLASALLPRLLDRFPEDVEVDCIVQPHLHATASRRVATLPGKGSERVRLYAGDITQPGLGLGSSLQEIQERCGEVYHLAALYNLAADRASSYAVNVEGTRNLLEMADGSLGLTRLHHISTCYVSGDYAGVFTESDLDVSQSFRNYYEETKFLSEKLVKDNKTTDYTTTIYRPSVVAGDRRTGVADKLDGLYYFILWILAQPRSLAVMPRIANTDRHFFNVVPSDFVVDAIAFLGGQEQSAGATYQLCDPKPPSIRQLLSMLERATDSRLTEIALPAWIAKRILRLVCALRDIDIPAEAIDYLAHPATYDATNTLADLPFEISVPDLEEYLPRMVAFVTGMNGAVSAAARRDRKHERK